MAVVAEAVVVAEAAGAAADERGGAPAQEGPCADSTGDEAAAAAHQEGGAAAEEETAPGRGVPEEAEVVEALEAVDQQDEERPHHGEAPEEAELEAEAEAEADEDADAGANADADAGAGAGADPACKSPGHAERERDMLIGEVGTMKAKFDLMLQTLRSIMVLKAQTSWADILEHVELLAGKAKVGTLIKDGEPLDDAVLRDQELKQAEAEVEELEEKVESQQAFIARLRELLQKQQGLLDMTTDQFEKQNEKSEKQEEKIAALEARDLHHQETMASQECRIAELTSHCEGLSSDLQAQRDLAPEQEAQLSARAARIEELEAELLSRDEQAARSLEQQRAEAQQDFQRQQEEIRGLEESLRQQGELVDRMTDQLQVHEAAERRRYSYRPADTRGSRSMMAEDEVSVHGSEQNSVCSARGPGPSLGALAGGVGLARMASGLEQDSIASTASTPLPSSRGHRGQAVHSNAPSKPPSPNSASAPSAAPLSAMNEEERMKFLAHFPMAARTERHMRNRIEERRKAKP